jgi:PEP-CTERM motif
MKSNLVKILAVGSFVVGGVFVGSGEAQAANIGPLAPSNNIINFNPVQVDLTYKGLLNTGGTPATANFFDIAFDIILPSSNFSILGASGAFSQFNNLLTTTGSTILSPITLPAGFPNNGSLPLPTSNFVVLDPADSLVDAFTVTNINFPASFTLEGSGGATVQITTKGVWTQNNTPIYNGNFTYSIALAPGSSLDGNGFQSVAEIQQFLESSPKNVTVSVQADATNSVPEPTTLGGLGLMGVLGLMFNKKRKNVLS